MASEFQMCSFPVFQGNEFFLSFNLSGNDVLPFLGLVTKSIATVPGFCRPDLLCDSDFYVLICCDNVEFLVQVQ